MRLAPSHAGQERRKQAQQRQERAHFVHEGDAREIGELAEHCRAYTAHSEGKPLETRHIVEELRSTRPLSVVRAEEVAALRQWAERRTVPAD